MRHFRYINHHYENVGLKFLMSLTMMELSFREWEVQDIIGDVKSPGLSNPFSLIPKDTAQQASS